MMDAFIVFFYSNLPAKDKSIYLANMVAIYKAQKVSPESRTRIREIQQLVSQKKMTDDGNTRNEKIIHHVFYEKKKTLLVTDFYCAVLHLLKQSVCIFKCTKPMIQKFHDRIIQFIQGFFFFLCEA